MNLVMTIGTFEVNHSITVEPLSMREAKQALGHTFSQAFSSPMCRDTRELATLMNNNVGGCTSGFEP